MLIVPTQATPSQTLATSLANQNVRLNIYQRFFGLFMDVLVNETRVIGGVVCRNLDLIVRDAYLGFSGDFVWLDNEGVNDPIYTGLGSRFSLCYVTAAEVARRAAGIPPPTVGITGGTVPTQGGLGGGGGGGGNPGAPTQFSEEDKRIQPFDYTVSAAFNGYQSGAEVTSAVYVSAVDSSLIIFASLSNNNTNNPDNFSADGSGNYGGWAPLNGPVILG